MGDRSPKDRDKKKKQHDRKIDEANRIRDERQKRAASDAQGGEPIRKAG